MGELRKDYVLDRWVIISPKRGKRPHELSKELSVSQKHTCFFCPGNEHLTPKEIGRVPSDGSWRLRWFENKFAAKKPKGDWHVKTHDRFFTFADTYGYHEVIVETNRHDKQLSDFSVSQVEDVLHVYARRILALERRPHIKYVNVFKNHGAKAGTSLVHSHSQVIADAVVPNSVREKIEAMQRFVECPYCRIVEVESRSDRRCFENDSFVAFTPYASRFNYEVWVFPKEHIARLEDVNFKDLAEVLCKILKKLKEGGIDYNFYVQYGPEGEDFHLHLEFCPRIALWGGFELCSDTIINSVSPEDAAKFYRGELK